MSNRSLVIRSDATMFGMNRNGFGGLFCHKALLFVLAALLALASAPATAANVTQRMSTPE
jgi:hypothetical protein